jgi:NADPH:quinone reductase-like Zn-dependent oxidoreductase
VHRAALEEILAVVVKGKVKPIISQVLSMARVADAHHHLSNRKTMGKVILQPRLA